jgi:hypothetical protein
MQRPRYITIKDACRMIGGDDSPIDISTYYRGAKAGRFPAPEHPSPGIARIDEEKLIERLRELASA